VAKSHLIEDPEHLRLLVPRRQPEYRGKGATSAPIFGPQAQRRVLMVGTARPTCSAGDVILRVEIS
jgi:hypothetical protein